jgi:hypothetical protein
VPGRPSRAEQAENRRAGRSRAARLVAVVGQPSVPAFAGATEYFDEIARYLDERYRPIEQDGEYAILVRRESARASQ